MSLSLIEEHILKSIVVASENNPNKPEFPADDPKFPATPTYQIAVPGFSNIWLKDESVNPTGTHKDRMAWEIIVTYREFLRAKKRGLHDRPLPQMSLISSGSAATAIQTQLRKYHLPNLKVLLHTTFNPTIQQSLKALGCEIYTADLDARPLSSREILELTENPAGFDITSNDALNPNTLFYDWLSYEILNNSPEYCFIPFGTGTLYENILNINRREVSAVRHDQRFRGNTEILRNCHFMGSTTHNPQTQAIKLYSPHLPFSHYNEQWIRLYQVAGFCGAQSGVSTFSEPSLEQALHLAEQQGINAEASGVAGLALMLQMQDQLPKDAKILIVNTGKTRYRLPGQDGAE